MKLIGHSILSVACIFIALIGAMEMQRYFIGEPPIPKDLVVYSAAFHVVQQGLDPYFMPHLEPLESPWYPIGYGPCAFLNPPWFLTLFTPLLLISMPSLFLVWRVATVLATLFAAYLLIAPKKPDEWAALLALSLFNLPLSVCLHWGQLGGFIALGAALLLFGFHSRSACALALGILLSSVKPHSYLIFSIFVVTATFVRFSWKTTLRCICVVLAVLILTHLWSPQLFPGWLSSIFGEQTAGSQSIYVLWADTIGNLISFHLGYPQPHIALVAIFVCFVLLFGVMSVFKKWLPYEELLILLIPLSSAVAPHGGIHDRVLLPLLPLIYWRRLSYQMRLFNLVSLGLAQFVGSELIVSTGKFAATWWIPWFVAILIFVNIKAISRLRVQQ